MANKKPLAKKALAPRTRQQPDSELKEVTPDVTTDTPSGPPIEDEVEETEQDDDSDIEQDENDESEDEEGEEDEEEQPAEPEYEAPPAPLDRTANPMVNQAADHEPSDYGALPGAPKGPSLVLGPDEPLRVDGEVSPDGTYIRLNKAVYRAKLPMGSKRWAFMLVYPMNAQIPVSIVQPINQTPDSPSVYPYSAQP